MLSASSRGSEIAAVLVNPLQSFHPNQAPPSDLTLVSNVRKAGSKDSEDEYRSWLAALKEACVRSGVVLIFDEVYTGFRLAPGGAQAYFNVQVTAQSVARAAKAAAARRGAGRRGLVSVSPPLRRAAWSPPSRPPRPAAHGPARTGRHRLLRQNARRRPARRRGLRPGAPDVPH